MLSFEFHCQTFSFGSVKHNVRLLSCSFVAKMPDKSTQTPPPRPPPTRAEDQRLVQVSRLLQVINFRIFFVVLVF